MRSPIALALLFVTACNQEPRDLQAPSPAPVQVAEEVAAPFGDDIQSLRVLRSIVVRAEPRPDAAPLGTVAQDMRVSWRQVARGPDCELWVEIEPRGWICDRYLEPNWRPPRTVELPKLPEGGVVPGEYAHVVGKRARVFGSVSELRSGQPQRTIRGSEWVRKQKEVAVRRRRYWRTASGEYIDARRLSVREPSTFFGVVLTGPDAPLLPFAWTVPSARRAQTVTVWEEPERWIERTPLPVRSPVPVLGRSGDGEMIRVGRDSWIAASDLRVAQLSSPPDEVRPGERWIDIDLDEQVLVAYEGTRPVFTTMVSSGARGNETPEGVYRIWIKFAETDMDGISNGRPYRVSSVPWVMFFSGNYALHTAYWHDRFGEPASSGCINLSPRDARLLYLWTSPNVPEGWTLVNPSPDQEGSIVRVRRSRVLASGFAMKASLSGASRPRPAP